MTFEFEQIFPKGESDIKLNFQIQNTIIWSNEMQHDLKDNILHHQFSK